jgi:molybdopterin-dependent oxidoreductase alpha subunit
MYAKGKNVIMCWAMGITQHRHSVATIQEIANLMLLRGNIGRPGAGLCPVRGHSNVQGDRTMGINECPPVAFLDSLERRFKFTVPRKNGHNVVEAIHAMADGRAKVFIGLGGNFAQATPDSNRTFQALANCDLTVQISTKLNRSHLAHGKNALILPCLGRTDIDIQTEGAQAVTVEDSFSMVHSSNGQLQPLSNQMRSEPAIIAGIAAATLGSQPVDWHWLVADYSRIRDLIADTIPGFGDFNEKIRNPGGFYLGNSAAARRWATPSGRANFRPNSLPRDLVHERTRATGVLPDLIMQSMRSHDQYNTTIYGLNDRYRGVKGQRDVLFVNEADIIRLGFKPGQKADIVSIWDDGRERRVKGFTLLAFDIPAGQAAAYYPEVNPLVPLESIGDGSQTPTSKFVAIRLEAASETQLIMAKSA